VPADSRLASTRPRNFELGRAPCGSGQGSETGNFGRCRRARLCRAAAPSLAVQAASITPSQATTRTLPASFTAAIDYVARERAPGWALARCTASAYESSQP
jgi:hypothetical protein